MLLGLCVFRHDLLILDDQLVDSSLGKTIFHAFSNHYFHVNFFYSCPMHFPPFMMAYIYIYMYWCHLSSGLLQATVLMEIHGCSFAGTSRKCNLSTHFLFFFAFFSTLSLSFEFRRNVVDV